MVVGEEAFLTYLDLETDSFYLAKGARHVQRRKQSQAQSSSRMAAKEHHFATTVAASQKWESSL
jgi:hypothetical protein